MLHLFEDRSTLFESSMLLQLDISCLTPCKFVFYSYKPKTMEKVKQPESKQPTVQRNQSQGLPAQLNKTLFTFQLIASNCGMPLATVPVGLRCCSHEPRGRKMV
jgi:hypothetical protein